MTAHVTGNRANHSAPLDCLYRTNVRGEGDEESAHCLLLSRILSESVEHCVVARPLCEACVNHTGQSFAHHPVFPSYVFERACERSASASTPESVAHWNHWLTKAEAAIVEASQPAAAPRVIPACDVILCVTDLTSLWRAVLESLLEQEDAVPIVHLVIRCETQVDLSAFTPRWNLLVHRWEDLPTLIATTIRLWPMLATESLTFPSEHHPPERGWLSGAMGRLRETGAVVTATQILQNAATASPEPERWTILPDTIALRRATLVDMLHHGLTAEDSTADIVALALRQKQRVELEAWRGPAPSHTVTISSLADNTALNGSSRPRCSMLPDTAAQCDVVLPFHGQLDYVREALESLLQQERATAIIHLIDDASPDDTTAFLDEWAQHPQLRVYRNRENVGQFQSFNNVAGYWETDLVAVQDADDISLPHRLAWAIAMLHGSGADYFGAAVELFGDEAVIRPVMHETAVLEWTPRASCRRSFYPEWSRADYFLENPTAVFRAAMFRRMGGYADFGDRFMNRTSLDTEFQLRCLYSGVRFAISQEIVTRYRVHASSATQDRATGWGSVARSESIRQVETRCRLFRDHQFDPRPFGALGRYTHLTERWRSAP